MSDRFAIPKSISKTAIDSLHAKLSAVDAGWLGTNDNNDSSSSLDGYTQILEQIHDGIEGPHSKRRRQTPLVNAGYAARMAVMTFILEKWIDSVVSRHHNNEGINVVVLGCGLDVLGLWSRNVLDEALTEHHHHDENQTPRLNVYEVDAWDNCLLKQHALERSGILKACRTTNKRNDDSAKESSFCAMIEGTINKATRKDDLSDYHLIAMDFRDICEDNLLLKKALDSTGFDPSQPTIILSELVLAYVGNESTNAILQSISRDLLCGNECSMFACLEPMLPTQVGQHHDSTNKKQLLSVKESYARDYANQFLGKLNRGTSSSSSSSADDDVFHPLGSNRETIIARFISCGFSMSNLDAASLRKAVAKVACTRRLSAKEPFDEHAALALNLDCYAVACAFGGSNNDGDVRCLLPWLDQSLNNSSSTIKIATIADSSQDKLVGDLYGRIYTHLYKKYPAIRKMVKSALKADLMADTTNDSSAIKNRFRARGGEFWIAIDMESFEVVGCIGVRQRKTKECEDEDDKEGPSSPFSVVEYEVQRLGVDDKHRGKGIGKRLLNAVYEYSLRQGILEKKKKKGVSVKLLAVTPEALVNANSLYNAFGFIKEESFEGGLTMNVYCKTTMI
eukprot:scaffold7350_cov176-Skeletonema_marinoi.AAC.7